MAYFLGAKTKLASTHCKSNALWYLGGIGTNVRKLGAMPNQRILAAIVLMGRASVATAHAYVAAR